MPKQLSWAAVATILGCLTCAWSLTSAWFSLQQRVHDLERVQTFTHGEIRAYLPTEAK